MKSKPFFLGVLAVAWLLVLVILCLGPGDSGSLLLAMLAPLVAAGSAVGLVWGIIERRRCPKPLSGSTAGMVLNGLVVIFAGIALSVWAFAEGWPRVSFRFPREIPVYPGTTILRKETARNSAGVLTRTWELSAYPEFGESAPHSVKAAAFYDQQLPRAEKRIDDNGGVHYSYLNSRGKRVLVTVTTASTIEIHESLE
jgi:hypothetical protein